MAGAGKGRPRKAGAVRPDQRKPMKVLEDRSQAKVPPMPDPDEWIAKPGENPGEALWSKPVIDWWESIWVSPMSSEFVNSDIHGLYLACMYLEESINPYNKATDRLKMGQAWEKTIQSYGLTPTARESLRWAISQGTQAENRTNQLRAQKQAETRESAAKNADGGNKIVDLYGKFGS